MPAVLIGNEYFHIYRYKKNTEVLKEEMMKMGFKQLYKDAENPNGYIVTSFQYPNIPQFVFDEFSKRLSDAGKVIVILRSYLAIICCAVLNKNCCVD